jgi:peptidoglycan/LPS O-acetylase OafA/YrhL
LLIFGIAGIAGVVTLAQFSMPLAVAAVIDACHLLPFIALYLGLLLLALERNSGTASTNVAARAMMFLGGISYGLYLVHSLIYTLYDKATESTKLVAVAPHFGNQLLRAVLGAVISILLAYLSRTYFEERFLRLKERWTSKPKRPTPEPQTVS